MIIPPLRGTDKHGSGHFGAPRGSRNHNGVDVACYAGSHVACYTPGVVTKLGHAYADDLKYQYVEVTIDGNKFRYFYVQPLVAVGDVLVAGDVVGVVQDLSARYPGITQHYHFEIIDPTGHHVNPCGMIAELSQ